MPGDSRLILLHAKKVIGDSPSMEEVGCLRLDSLEEEPKEVFMYKLFIKGGLLEETSKVVGEQRGKESK